MDKVIKVLQLARTNRVGPVAFKTLLSFYKDIDTIIENIPRWVERGGGENIQLYPIQKAKEEYNRLQEIGGFLIDLTMPDYPRRLKGIPDSPIVLSGIGYKSLLNKEKVALVGTRNASLNGRNFARKISFDLGQKGYKIVSGMASGMDRCAHEGALESGTIAVLGTGVNVPYPTENKDIYEDIKRMGLVLSEYPLDTKPMPYQFPARNRIIAGLSEGVIVVEAQLKSGSLITADCALKYGRHLFAVPGSPMDERASGVNRLIQNGANLITGADDVVKILKEKTSFCLRDSALMSDFNWIPDIKISDREKVISLLSYEPIFIDKLIEECHIPTQVVHVILVELELSDRIIRYPSNYISLKMK